MTTFLLIRHALCDPVGTSIAGRAPGIHLNDTGRRQATALAQRLAALPIAAVFSSPLERAVQTAQPLAGRLGLPVFEEPKLNEVDFGEWTGLTLADLAGMPGWREFNVQRRTARIPGGETMTQVVDRGVATLNQISQSPALSGRVVALVSHGDVLRSLITRCIGVDLDHMHRIEIAPASVSILSGEEPHTRLLLLNSTENWPPEVASATR